MKDTIVFRRATPSDVDGLAKLWTALVSLPCHTEFKSSLKPHPLEQWKKEMRRSLRRRDNCVLVAERDNTLVGYIIAVTQKRGQAIFKNRKYLLIGNLYVDPSARGHGLGSRLLSAALAWGKKRGLKEAGVNAASRNSPGIATYEKAGFVTTALSMNRKI